MAITSNNDDYSARRLAGREFGGQSKFFASTGAEPGAVDYTRYPHPLKLTEVPFFL